MVAVEDGRFRLHVEELAAGTGASPPIVLLHGFGASSATWAPIVGTLIDSAGGRRVVAFDRLGFGRSARPRRREWEPGAASPYRPEAAADHTLAVLDALGIERAVLVAHSAGAVSAVLVALSAPERVVALGLLAPAVLTDGPPRLVAAAFGVPVIAATAPWVLRRSAGLLPRAVRSAWHDPARVTPEVVERYRAPLRTPGWEHALVEMTRATTPLRLAARLGDVTAPAVLVTGASDRIVPPRAAARIARLLGGPTSLTVVPEAGHLVHEERPDAVATALAPVLELP